MKDEFFQIDEKTWISPKFSDITKNIVYTGKYFFYNKANFVEKKKEIKFFIS